MSIVLRFDSLDCRQRATLVLETPELAAQHVAKILNGGRRRGSDLWTLDEEGKEVPTIKGLVASLRDRNEVKLYDQGAWYTDDTLTIEQANESA